MVNEAAADVYLVTRPLHASAASYGKPGSPRSWMPGNWDLFSHWALLVRGEVFELLRNKTDDHVFFNRDDWTFVNTQYKWSTPRPIGSTTLSNEQIRQTGDLTIEQWKDKGEWSISGNCQCFTIRLAWFTVDKTRNFTVENISSKGFPWRAANIERLIMGFGFVLAGVLTPAAFSRILKAIGPRLASLCMKATAGYIGKALTAATWANLGWWIGVPVGAFLCLGGLLHLFSPESTEGFGFPKDTMAKMMDLFRKMGCLGAEVDESDEKFATAV